MFKFERISVVHRKVKKKSTKDSNIQNCTVESKEEKLGCERRESVEVVNQKSKKSSNNKRGLSSDCVDDDTSRLEGCTSEITSFQTNAKVNVKKNQRNQRNITTFLNRVDSIEECQRLVREDCWRRSFFRKNPTADMDKLESTVVTISNERIEETNEYDSIVRKKFMGRKDWKIITTMRNMIEPTRNFVTFSQGIGAFIFELLEGERNAVEGRLDTSESKITTLESETNEVKGRMNAAEPKITTLEGETGTVERRLDTAEPKITAVEGRLDTTEPKLSSFIIFSKNQKNLTINIINSTSESGSEKENISVDTDCEDDSKTISHERKEEEHAEGPSEEHERVEPRQRASLSIERKGASTTHHSGSKKQIFVRNVMTMKTSILELEKEQTILDLKKQYEDKTGLPTSYCSIYESGKRQEDWIPLKEVKSVTLYSVSRLPGGDPEGGSETSTTGTTPQNSSDSENVNEAEEDGSEEEQGEEEQRKERKEAASTSTQPIVSKREILVPKMFLSHDRKVFETVGTFFDRQKGNEIILSQEIDEAMVSCIGGIEQRINEHNKKRKRVFESSESDVIITNIMSFIPPMRHLHDVIILCSQISSIMTKNLFNNYEQTSNYLRVTRNHIKTTATLFNRILASIQLNLEKYFNVCSSTNIFAIVSTIEQVSKKAGLRIDQISDDFENIIGSSRSQLTQRITKQFISIHRLLEETTSLEKKSLLTYIKIKKKYERHPKITQIILSSRLQYLEAISTLCNTIHEDDNMRNMLLRVSSEKYLLDRKEEVSDLIEHFNRFFSLDVSDLTPSQFTRKTGLITSSSHRFVKNDHIFLFESLACILSFGRFALSRRNVSRSHAMFINELFQYPSKDMDEFIKTCVRSHYQGKRKPEKQQQEDEPNSKRQKQTHDKSPNTNYFSNMPKKKQVAPPGGGDKPPSSSDEDKMDDKEDDEDDKDIVKKLIDEFLDRCTESEEEFVFTNFLKYGRSLDALEITKHQLERRRRKKTKDLQQNQQKQQQVRSKDQTRPNRPVPEENATSFTPLESEEIRLGDNRMGELREDIHNNRRESIFIRRSGRKKKKKEENSIEGPTRRSVIKKTKEDTSNIFEEDQVDQDVLTPQRKSKKKKTASQKPPRAGPPLSSRPGPPSSSTSHPAQNHSEAFTKTPRQSVGEGGRIHGTDSFPKKKSEPVRTNLNHEKQNIDNNATLDQQQQQYPQKRSGASGVSSTFMSYEEHHHHHYHQQQQQQQQQNIPQMVGSNPHLKMFLDMKQNYYEPNKEKWTSGNYPKMTSEMYEEDMIAIHAYIVGKSSYPKICPDSEIVKGIQQTKGGKGIQDGTLRLEFGDIRYNGLLDLGLPESVIQRMRRTKEGSGSYKDVYTLRREGLLTQLRNIHDFTLNSDLNPFQKFHFEQYDLTQSKNYKRIQSFKRLSANSNDSEIVFSEKELDDETRRKNEELSKSSASTLKLSKEDQKAFSKITRHSYTHSASNLREKTDTFQRSLGTYESRDLSFRRYITYGRCTDNPMTPWDIPFVKSSLERVEQLMIMLYFDQGTIMKHHNNITFKGEEENFHALSETQKKESISTISTLTRMVRKEFFRTRYLPPRTLRIICSFMDKFDQSDARTLAMIEGIFFTNGRPGAVACMRKDGVKISIRERSDNEAMHLLFRKDLHFHCFHEIELNKKYYGSVKIFLPDFKNMINIPDEHNQKNILPTKLIQLWLVDGRLIDRDIEEVCVNGGPRFREDDESLFAIPDLHDGLIPHDYSRSTSRIRLITIGCGMPVGGLYSIRKFTTDFVVIQVFDPTGTITSSLIFEQSISWSSAGKGKKNMANHYMNRELYQTLSRASSKQEGYDFIDSVWASPVWEDKTKQILYDAKFLKSTSALYKSFLLMFAPVPVLVRLYMAGPKFFPFTKLILSKYEKKNASDVFIESKKVKMIQKIRKNLEYGSLANYMELNDLSEEIQGLIGMNRRMKIKAVRDYVRVNINSIHKCFNVDDLDLKGLDRAKKRALCNACCGDYSGIQIVEKIINGEISIEESLEDLSSSDASVGIYLDMFELFIARESDRDVLRRACDLMYPRVDPKKLNHTKATKTLKKLVEKERNRLSSRTLRHYKWRFPPKTHKKDEYSPLREYYRGVIRTLLSADRNSEIHDQKIEFLDPSNCKEKPIGDPERNTTIVPLTKDEYVLYLDYVLEAEEEMARKLDQILLIETPLECPKIDASDALMSEIAKRVRECYLSDVSSLSRHYYIFNLNKKRFKKITKIAKKFAPYAEFKRIEKKQWSHIIPEKKVKKKRFSLMDRYKTKCRIKLYDFFKRFLDTDKRPEKLNLSKTRIHSEKKKITGNIINGIFLDFLDNESKIWNPRTETKLEWENNSEFDHDITPHLHENEIECKAFFIFVLKCFAKYSPLYNGEKKLQKKVVNRRKVELNIFDDHKVAKDWLLESFESSIQESDLYQECRVDKNAAVSFEQVLVTLSLRLLSDAAKRAYNEKKNEISETHLHDVAFADSDLYPTWKEVFPTGPNEITPEEEEKARRIQSGRNLQKKTRKDLRRSHLIREDRKSTSDFSARDKTRLRRLGVNVDNIKEKKKKKKKKKLKRRNILIDDDDEEEDEQFPFPSDNLIDSFLDDGRIGYESSLLSTNFDDDVFMVFFDVVIKNTDMRSLLDHHTINDPITSTIFKILNMIVKWDLEGDIPYLGSLPDPKTRRIQDPNTNSFSWEDIEELISSSSGRMNEFKSAFACSALQSTLSFNIVNTVKRWGRKTELNFFEGIVKQFFLCHTPGHWSVIFGSEQSTGWDYHHLCSMNYQNDPTYLGDHDLFSTFWKLRFQHEKCGRILESTSDIPGGDTTFIAPKNESENASLRISHQISQVTPKMAKIEKQRTGKLNCAVHAIIHSVNLMRMSVQDAVQVVESAYTQMFFHRFMCIQRNSLRILLLDLEVVVGKGEIHANFRDSKSRITRAIHKIQEESQGETSEDDGSAQLLEKQKQRLIRLTQKYDETTKEENEKVKRIVVKWFLKLIQELRVCSSRFQKTE